LKDLLELYLFDTNGNIALGKKYVSSPRYWI